MGVDKFIAVSRITLGHGRHMGFFRSRAFNHSTTMKMKFTILLLAGFLAAPGPVTKKFTSVSVDVFISSLTATLIFRLIATPVAALPGMVKVTVGTVLSSDPPVTKHQAKSVKRILRKILNTGDDRGGISCIRRKLTGGREHGDVIGGVVAYLSWNGIGFVG